MRLVKGMLLGMVALGILGCTNPSDTEEKTGTLIIRSYPETITDPSSISSENPINAILDVEYPNGSIKTIVTDELGFYDFGNIDPGTYRITPRYITEAVATEITVGKGEHVSETILLPYIEIAYYLLNGNAAALSNASVREALAKGIDRAAVITASVSDSDPLFGLIPARMSGPWCESAVTLNEDVNRAQTLIGATVVEVNLTYNANIDVNQPIAVAVQSNWQAIGDSVTVNLDPVTWDELVTIRDVNKTFEAARDGWGYDSNNPLSLFKALVTINTPAYTTLLQETEAHLSDGDIAAFEAGIVALNDYALSNYLVIPFYQNR